jgi:hypothetical protein
MEIKSGKQILNLFKNMEITLDRYQLIKMIY